MQVVLPTLVVPPDPYNRSWTPRYYFPDGKIAALAIPRDARYMDIQDLLIEKTEPLGVQAIMKGRRRSPRRRYNPVIHVKALDDFYSPNLESEDIRLLTLTNFCRGTATIADTVQGDSTVVVVVDQRVSGTHVTGIYAQFSTRSAGTSLLWDSIERIEFDSTLRSYTVLERWVPYSWAYRGYFTISPGESPYQRVRDLIANPPNWVVRMNGGKYGSDNPVDTLPFNPSVDAEQIVSDVHRAMRACLRFNEPELFARSSYDNALSRFQPPDLQMALGDAYDRAIQPQYDEAGRLTNAGLPTLGFNNLQNLGSLVSGLMALGFGKAEGTLDALSGLRTLRGNKEDLYERLVAIGRRSTYRMTHDPDWVKLTSSQQRRLLKRAEISSMMNSANADLAVLDGMKSSSSDFDVISDTWFRGRYEWSTSWSDAEQAYRYFWYKMQQSLGQEPEHPCLHGRSFFTLSDGTEVKACVTFACRERVTRGFAKLAKYMWETGTAPTAAVLYDFIPLSFVVDWFFPVQGALEQFDRTQYLSPQYYSYLWPRFCCSVKYKATTYLGFRVQCYARWYQGDAPQPDLGHTVLANDGSPSDVTTAFRFTDGVLLLLRRK